MTLSQTWHAPLFGLVLAACLSLPALAADESTDNATGDTCFWISSINDFRAIDNQHVFVRGGGKNQRYLLTLMGYCNSIRFAETISLDSRPTTRLCSNGNEHLTVIDSGGLQERCLISDVEAVEDLDAARKVVAERTGDASVANPKTDY